MDTNYSELDVYSLSTQESKVANDEKVIDKLYQGVFLRFIIHNNEVEVVFAENSQIQKTFNTDKLDEEEFLEELDEFVKSNKNAI